MRKGALPSATRRRLLKALAAAPLAAAAPVFGGSARAERLLVLVFLYGGNDGYNTWVPYSDPLYYALRPHLAVPRDAVLKVTERHGFHPALEALMPAWQARELALVQGIGNADATQQHYRDCEMAFTACDGGEFYREGWVSRALARGARDPLSLADALAFDVLDIQAADPMGPFRGEKLAVVQVHYAFELLAKRRLADCAIDANPRGRERLARSSEALAPVALKTDFPADPFGQAMRATVELAALDRALPVIHVALNGLDSEKHHSLDTHWNQLSYHGEALRRLAEGLAALRSGLREIGRWDETLVATYDEFGRSPMENADEGTHHGLANTHFVLGGRVKGGLLGAAPPMVRMHPIGGPPPVVDTRRLWSTVVERWWESEAAGLFARRYAPLDLLRA
ncbi:MAG TPA: DUF1501 domain-containing protein [Usitatibacter sp.]|nr:DUF1501 domain-containing protein [Usitatibacter sp.]